MNKVLLLCLLLWLQPLLCMADEWRFEWGTGSLQRQTVWRDAQTQELNFPLLMARYGRWQLGMENGLVQYQYPLGSWQLSGLLGLRDETFDSRLWSRVHSDDPVYDGYHSGGGDTVAGVNLAGSWFCAALSQDISGHSEALTADAHLILPLFYMTNGPRAQLLAGGRWLSQNYTQHVFGVSAQQAADNRPRYTTDDAFNPQLTLQTYWQMSRNWLLRLRWQQEWYAPTLTDSPLTGQRVERQAMLLLTWSAQ